LACRGVRTRAQPTFHRERLVRRPTPIRFPGCQVAASDRPWPGLGVVDFARRSLSGRPLGSSRTLRDENHLCSRRGEPDSSGGFARPFDPISQEANLAALGALVVAVLVHLEPGVGRFGRWNDTRLPRLEPLALSPLGTPPGWRSPNHGRDLLRILGIADAGFSRISRAGR
jgi:hypothetical protein